MAKKSATILYMPALHAGYLSFFAKHPGMIFLIGDEFQNKIARLERDIRKVPAEKMQHVLAALGYEVGVLTPRNIQGELSKMGSITMPDEEVSRFFAENYFSKRRVRFVPIFLRWDRKITDREFEVSPDQVISTNPFDVRLIDRAAKEGTKSPDWWRQIGAVLVRGKKPILFSHNKHLPSSRHVDTYGDPRSNFDAGEKPEVYLSIHAEMLLLIQAAREGISVKGAALYTSTFPCPNCARAIAESGITTVYYAKGYSLRDAEDILKSRGVKIVLVKK